MAKAGSSRRSSSRRVRTLRGVLEEVPAAPGRSSQRARYGLKVGRDLVPFAVSPVGSKRRWANLPQYVGHQVVARGVVAEGILHEGECSLAPFEKTSRQVREITILNERQSVNVGQRKDKIRVSGHLTDPDGGLYLQDGHLVLIGFEGRLEHPPGVRLHYKSGLQSLDTRVVEHFAPTLALLAPIAPLAAAVSPSTPEDLVRMVKANTKSTGRDFFFGPDPSRDPFVLQHRERQAEAERFHERAKKTLTAKDLGAYLNSAVANAPNLLGPDKAKIYKGSIRALEMRNPKRFIRHAKAIQEHRVRQLVAEEHVAGEIKKSEQRLRVLAKRAIRNDPDNSLGKLPEAVTELFQMTETPIVSTQGLVDGLIKGAIAVLATYLIYRAVTGAAERYTKMFEERNESHEEAMNQINQDPQSISERAGDFEEAVEEVACYQQLQSRLDELKQENVTQEVIDNATVIVARAKKQHQDHRGVSRAEKTRKEKHRGRLEDQWNARVTGKLPGRLKRKFREPFAKKTLGSFETRPVGPLTAAVLALDRDAMVQAIVSTCDASIIGQQTRRSKKLRMRSLLDSYAAGKVTDPVRDDPEDFWI